MDVGHNKSPISVMFKRKFFLAIEGDKVSCSSRFVEEEPEVVIENGFEEEYEPMGVIDSDSEEDYEAPANDDNNDDNDDDSDDGGSEHEEQPLQLRKRSRAKTAAAKKMQKEAQDREFQAQIEFLVILRDNNQPDSFGTNSITTGPLCPGEVAAAYNERHGTTITAHNIMSRYYRHRHKMRTWHPNYPETIRYAEKEGVLRKRKSRANPSLIRKSVSKDTISKLKDVDDDWLRNWNTMYLERWLGPRDSTYRH